MTSPNTADLEKRDALVEAMLAHVPFDGWSMAARDAAAEDIKMDTADAMRLIADDADAIDAYTDLSDRQMARALDALDPRPEKISAIIRAAVLCRLENAEPHREAVAQALKLLARPQHAQLAAKTLYRTIDRIWRLTGDRAVDFSFYTKRATLAGVYSATLLYWVANPNADRARTEAFLDARLREVAMIPKVTAPAKKAAEMGLKMAGKLMGRMPMRRPG
ncbi:MAG: COQ9 family protein [Alphaproteobacteria bacterium]|nr:COQ9 family protein [Alphaproteobacteria bacterium]